ncbi:tryptophan--tRNA ligase [Alkaliphilus peptidifermentans]|uniref:Tryptophan--tRNA ligase n=1 Tax=Alkaliphilus peptidifermentans DSM 18978 TaxID=1120976 RepID=A0A1G5I537_9FIRM|nr:tryptophan--tRNA ligase [Alkaliphilus peptidifermentans]SCY70901.1 tryptophanyl-tRNA synthetase [Alkaliphilus peptidifermentans DSM 18978]
MTKKMLTGVRPTGLLHLGHYIGAFKEYIHLQPQYENFLIISDLHMLTTRCSKEDIAVVGNNAKNIIIDSIAMGIDPHNTTFYLQSNIPELTYIFVLIQNLITIGRAKATPSLTKITREIGIENLPLGLLAYPVLEAGDILSVQADIVPVGKDNIDHISMTQEIIDRINKTYGADFPIPECISEDKNFVIGLDGAEKMSKSLNNTIFIRDNENVIEDKISQIPWVSPQDTSTVNPIIEYLQIFEEDKRIALSLRQSYFDGQDVEREAREQLNVTLNTLLNPMRTRVEKYTSNPELVDEILKDGTLKTRERVNETLEKLKNCMGMYNCCK